jgi:hypothetical protein
VCASLASVTILIDEARWWHRGRRWCHLVSDESLDELHRFADATGIPRRGFQGDHYDIPEDYRDDVIEAGATVVESRELLRRLKAAGLRLTPAQRRRATSGITGGVGSPVTNGEARRGRRADT